MNRRTVAWAILIAWVASLGWLAFRRMGGPRRIATGQRVPPGAAYYRVSWGGRQVGLASITVDTLAPSDTAPAMVRLSERLVLVLAGPHGPVREELASNAFLSTALTLRSMEVRLSGAEGRGFARITVTGDSTLIASIDSTGGPWRSTQRIDGPVIPLGAVPIDLAYRERPDVGATVSRMVFDPTTLEFYATGVTVTGDSTFIVPDSVVRADTGYVVALTDTLHAWRVAYHLHGVPVHGWFDVNGFPVATRAGGGLTFERTAFDIANDGLKALDDSVREREALLAAPPPAGPGDSALAAGNTGWRMLLPGADYPGLEGTGPLQAWSGDTLALLRMPYLPVRDPMRPLEPIPMTDVRFRATLRGEPRLSPDDTAITALARKVVGRETSARIAAARLLAWVHANVAFIGDSAGGAWPTASQVLGARRGSAAGIVTLFTALARRVGLPARPVAGLLVARDRVRSHAWAEVFIGDWVPVDPAFGQFPATPAHARLIVGGTTHWAEYVPAAGALHPTVFLDGE